MCYEFERLYWLQRAEALRREKNNSAALEKPGSTPVPDKSSDAETDLEQALPVPV